MRRDLGLGERAGGVAREHERLVERAVVAAARGGDGAADRAHAFLRQRLAGEGRQLLARQVGVRQTVLGAEVADEASHLGDDVACEDGGLFAVELARAFGVGGEVLRRAQLGREIGEPSHGDLLLVDVARACGGNGARKRSLELGERFPGAIDAQGVRQRGSPQQSA